MKLLPQVSNIKNNSQYYQSHINDISNIKSNTFKNLIYQAKQLIKYHKNQKNKSQSFYHQFYHYIENIIRLFFKKHIQIQQDLVHIFNESVYMFQNQGNILCKIHNHQQTEPRSKKLLHLCLKEQFQLLQKQKQKINIDINAFNQKVNEMKEQFKQKMKILQIKYNNGIQRVKRQQRQKHNINNKNQIQKNKGNIKKQQRFSLNPLNEFNLNKLGYSDDNAKFKKMNSLNKQKIDQNQLIRSNNSNNNEFTNKKPLSNLNKVYEQNQQRQSISEKSISNINSNKNI